VAAGAGGPVLNAFLNLIRDYGGWSSRAKK